jgi:hypothetical protein
MNKYIAIFALSVLFFLPVSVFAKTDLSILESDITFSKNPILDGDVVRVYARIFNTGDTDATGFLDFYSGTTEISTPQSISLRPNTYDDVFIDWKATAGTHAISAKIVGTNPPDENAANNVTAVKEVFVDTDTNHNGIGDSKEHVAATGTTNTTTVSGTANVNGSGSLTDILSALSQGGITGMLNGAGSSVKKVFGENGTITMPNANNSSDKPQDNQKYVYGGLAILGFVVLLFWFRTKDGRRR